MRENLFSRDCHSSNDATSLLLLLTLTSCDLVAPVQIGGFTRLSPARRIASVVHGSGKSLRVVFLVEGFGW